MVVKAKPSCQHCGATLRHSWSRCERCGKRSWVWLLGGFGRRT
jgi:primosomal protein N'